MNPSVDSQIGPLESGGHPPVYGRKRKTTTRSTKKESTRSGGVAAPMNPDVDLASSTNAPSSYTIGNLDEKTELGKIFATQARSQVLSIRTAKSDNFTKGEDERHRGSSDTSATGDRPSHTSHGNQMSGDKHEDDQSQNDDSQHIPGDGSDDDDQGRDSSIDEHNIGQLEDDTVQHAIDDESASSYQGDQEPVQRYGAESRLYHAYYDELIRARLRGHYTWCRQHCMNLLLEPRIPLWTRIQTLQLLSTLNHPAGAEQCLNEADQIIDMLNPEQLQTRLLREDNRKMKANMMAWRVEHNLVGQDVESRNNRGELPADEPVKPEVEAESAGATDKATATSETG